MKQKLRKKIAISVIFSMVMAMYSFMPMVNTANAVNSLTAASATLSDTDLGLSATTTFAFTTATSTAINGYFDITMTAPFGDVLVGNITCPANYTASAPNTETVRCTATSLVAPGSKQITLANTANPSSAGSQVLLIEHYDISSNLAERAQVVVYIIDDVLMTARVDATLTFTISGTSTGAVVNGLTCNATTTATSTPFGTLAPGTPTNVCQQLNVTTNASQGFTVTVEQDQEMTSDGGDNINSFDNNADGTGSTTAHAWTAPTGILDQDQTYGHMGLTSDDTDLSSLGGYNDFYNSGSPLFAGLNSTDPMPVFHHDGPADGDTNATQDKGKAMVLYRAEINALQQAGDYESTLTYIATPIY